MIEKFVEGDIIDNSILFTKNFCFRIFNFIDKQIYNLTPDISKKNIILEYINFLKKYIISYLYIFILSFLFIAKHIYSLDNPPARLALLES